MAGKERPWFKERLKNMVEGDRTTDVLRVTGVFRRQNVSQVCIVGHSLEYTVTDDDEVFYHRSKSISGRVRERLKSRGIAIGITNRPGGRIIPRLTQKRK